MNNSFTDLIDKNSGNHINVKIINVFNVEEKFKENLAVILDQSTMKYGMAHITENGTNIEIISPEAAIDECMEKILDILEDKMGSENEDNNFFTRHIDGVIPKKITEIRSQLSELEEQIDYQKVRYLEALEKLKKENGGSVSDTIKIELEKQINENVEKLKRKKEPLKQELEELEIQNEQIESNLKNEYEELKEIKNKMDILMRAMTAAQECKREELGIDKTKKNAIKDYEKQVRRKLSLEYKKIINKTKEKKGMGKGIDSISEFFREKIINIKDKKISKNSAEITDIIQQCCLLADEDIQYLVLFNKAIETAITNIAKKYNDNLLKRIKYSSLPKKTTNNNENGLFGKMSKKIKSTKFYTGEFPTAVRESYQRHKGKIKEYHDTYADLTKDLNKALDDTLNNGRRK